jgi:general stress protein 26
MDFAAVLDHAARLGPIMYLATVTPAGDPHVVPVHIDWHEGAAWSVAGTSDVKTRNIAAHPAVCLHSSVSEVTGWDHLMVWGDAAFLADVETKRRMWSGVFGYDLDDFAPGGPEDSPETGFLRITPYRVVLLRRYGFGGRDDWRP